MGNIDLNDIGLKEYNLENMPLLKRLREGLLKTGPEICIERAKFLADYLKNMSTADEPMEIRYAKAVNYFLSNKAPLFFDESLLAGTTTSKPFGAPVYPEWTGLTIWPELDTISDREKNPLTLSSEDVKTLNFDIFPYWMGKNILEYTRRKYCNPECMKLMERIVFFIGSEAGTISHAVPNYRTALEKGLEYIIEEAVKKEAELINKDNRSAEEDRSLHFYQAAQIAIKGIINYAGRLSAKASELAERESDPNKKVNYQRMADVCARVPAKPARTFREAVNSIWLIQVGIHAENINMAMSPGRLDQVLYNYYRTDMDRGLLKPAKILYSAVQCITLQEPQTSALPIRLIP